MMKRIENIEELIDNLVDTGIYELLKQLNIPFLETNRTLKSIILPISCTKGAVC